MLFYYKVLGKIQELYNLPKIDKHTLDIVVFVIEKLIEREKNQDHG